MAKKQSRRAERCAYLEGGARCRRSGTGNPPLCHPHRLVMQDAGRPPPSMGEGIKNLVDRFVNGRRVTRKVWEGAIGDIAAFMMAQQQEAHRQQHAGNGQSGGGFRPPPGAPPPPSWEWVPEWARPRPPPPPDPAIEERKRARLTLGFSPTEKLTLEIIQKRRRDLARKHHPDRGGSVAKMQTINAAADVLEQSLAVA